MSKNHPNDNIYSILGKLQALQPTPQEKHDATVKSIYESVEAQGSILKGLREVSSTEQRLAEQFAAEGKDQGKPGKTFAKIAKSAGEHYGSAEAGKRVAGAVKAKLAKQGKLEEKWGTEMHTAEKDKGMFKGKTQAELKSQLAKLKASGPHEKGSDAYKKQNQIEFALRAKHKFGKVGEQNIGPGTGGMEEDIASFGMGEEHTLDEKAPPGMEDMVMKLKKEYPGHPEKAFATAWSIYNKKHGKKSEGMEEAKHIGTYGTEYYKSDDFKGKDSDDYGTKEPKAKKPKQDRRGAPIKAASDRSDASLPWGGKPPKDTYKHQKGSFVHNVKDISRNPEADAAFARDEKIAKAKGHKKPASESKLAQRFNNIMEGRMIDESGETLEHILNRFRAEVKAFEKGGEIDRDLYDALYDYYVECGEMPYGVQKARTDDPLNWVCNKLDAEIGNLAYGRDPANAEGYGIEDEGIEGKFPHVSVPGKDTLLKTPVTPWEKAKAVAKDTAKGMMGHKDVEHFGTGHPQESVEPTMEAELNELAKLAGLKIADEGNAFTGKLAKTEKGDKFELDGKTYKDTSDLDEGTCPTCNAKPCACNEGNEFSGELAKAKAQHKDTFNVDGKEYPVKESITTLKDIASLAGIATEGKDYGDTDIEETPTYDNTPEEETYDEEVLLKGGDGEVAGQEKKMSKYGAARFSDNPMAMKKEVEEGVNPLDTLGRKLLKAYESIKIQK